MASPQLSFDASSVKFPAKKVFGPIVLFILGFIIFRSIVTFVPPGHVGVVYDRGRGVLDKPLHEELTF
jgi:hypothetical protein